MFPAKFPVVVDTDPWDTKANTTLTALFASHNKPPPFKDLSRQGVFDLILI